jgi:hypothetical protein
MTMNQVKKIPSFYFLFRKALNYQSSMPNDPTLEMLFELAMQAEKTAEEFYAGLAEKFRHLPEVAAFWLTFSKEEEGHALELEKIRGALSPDQLATLADPAVFLKATKNRNTSALTLLNSVRNLHEAYELAHELESGEVNAVYGFLMSRFIASDWRRQFVLSEIKVHQARIMQFSSTFGGVEWRKGILATPSAGLAGNSP